MKKQLERLVALGRLKDGKLEFNNEPWFKGHLSLYDDAPVRILVERRTKSKTGEQRGYLWGVVYDYIAKHTGYSPDELHEIFKGKFLKSKFAWRGFDIFTVRGTSDMTSNEMAEFISKVILEANEMGIEIPEPDKAYQFK